MTAPVANAPKPKPIATPGPRVGPVGLVPRCVTLRRGYVEMDKVALDCAKLAGGKVRDYVPKGAGVTDVYELAGVVTIVFASPACRELSLGEITPRYTMREARNGAWWWEEVKP